MAFFNHLPGKKFGRKSRSAEMEGERSGERKSGGRFGKGGKSKQRERGDGRDFASAAYRPERGRKPFSSFKKQENRFAEEVKTPAYLKYEYDNRKPPRRPEHEAEERQEPDENLLVGRNPIREALKSGRDIEKLLVLKGEISGSATEIIAKARALKIPVQEVEKKRLDQIASHHQGLIAFASAYQYHDVDDILRAAEEKGEQPFIVMLDGVTDPHNLGAIIRSAECAGAHGVIIPQRRSAGLTATAVKASAGAVEHIMVARVTNLKGVVDSLKRKGLWVYAADMAGEDYGSVDFSGPCLLLIGSEGEGISQLLLETADKKVSIAMKGKIDSLNASVAAGILLFQIAKGR